VPDLRTSAANRALAGELRRLRDLAVMSGDEVASELHWSASKISRIETNRIGIKPADLSRLIDLYNRRSDRLLVDETRRSQLMALSAEPEPRGWWNAYTDSIRPDYLNFISLEDSARELRCWSPEIVHGLLQTPAYALAVIETQAKPGTDPPGQIQRRIDVRRRRQALLAPPASKPVTFILDESVLVHRYGTAEVMHQQLSTLVEVSRYPNVSLRVLPFGGAHPIQPGGFIMLAFASIHGTALSDLVYLEHLTGSSLIEDEDDVHEYQQAFGRLSEAALDEDESREFISDVAAERWS
jgi:transcriptional regulator with XRE-family HTH domain